MMQHNISHLSPELLVDLPCRIGEGPLWHPEEKKIYWTDIPNARICRCLEDGSLFEQFDTGDEVGGFTFQEDSSLLLFMSRGAVRCWRDGEFVGTVLEEVADEKDSRFNDVIADPAGRVYCGTMSSPNHGGRFYRLELDGSLTLLRENMQTPNGMGFSPDQKYFYQNDSRACATYRFRYHHKNGELSDREIIFATAHTSDKGRPDGLTVDSEGCIWTGRWDGWRIARHTPDGEVISEIEFPVKKVPSLAIAGADWRTGFCSTAGGDQRGPGEGELAGSLFRCRPMPAPGMPEHRSKVKVW